MCELTSPFGLLSRELTHPLVTQWTIDTMGSESANSCQKREDSSRARISVARSRTHVRDSGSGLASMRQKHVWALGAENLQGDRQW